MSTNNNEEQVLFKLIYIFRRQIDELSLNQLKDLLGEEITVSQLPYFMSIGYSGISNHELLKDIRVTRQGVSKTVKELERLGLVCTSRNLEDARTIMINLTKQGRDLYDKIRMLSDNITSEYIQILGEEKYESMIDSLKVIIKHTETKCLR